MQYTHIFSNATRELRPIQEAPSAVREAAFRALGFKLVDANRVKFDQHGMPCTSTGGWSYGHLHAGWICAGAGGLNSMRVTPL